MAIEPAETTLFRMGSKIKKPVDPASPANPVNAHRRLRTFHWSLQGSLFGLALVIYIATRLIGLVQFPIYFFTDEAVQTVLAGDLVRDGFRNYDKVLLPTYFKNGSYYNLSTSVYLQVIPTLIFGKSEFVTRATAAMMTVLAAIAISLILKDVLKTPFWWCGALLLAIAPAWFLHSRTAFETTLFCSFYAVTMYCYLLYRYRSPLFLFPAIFFACLAFYTYSPGQVIVAATAALLILSDLSYHWKNKKTVAWGALLLLVLAIPYIRFRISNGTAPLNQLRELNSYWLHSGSIWGKLGQFARQYLHGLDWRYWFLPQQDPHLVDLPRHIMKGWGNLMLFTLPFFMVGLFMILWNLHSSAHRLLLASLLAAPVGEALVALGITRILVFTIPATILIGLGFSKVLTLLSNPAVWWRSLHPPEFLCIFWNGGKRLVEKPLFPIPAKRPQPATKVRWNIPLVYPSLVLFLGLAFAGGAMTRDALVNGPTWYSNYGMDGLQWGARQVFSKIQVYLAEHPGTRILLTPEWTNGTDVVARFFLPPGLPFDLGSVKGHINQYQPLDDNLVFVMLASDLDLVNASEKFKDIQVESDQTILYPDGTPGFLFVRLKYVDDIQQIFEAESQARRQLLQTVLSIDGQLVSVRYSQLDLGKIDLLFDHSPYEPARTVQSNPFVVELTFTEPRPISGLRVIIGSLLAEVKASVTVSPDAAPQIFSITRQGSVDNPEITLEFGKTLLARVLRVEVRGINTGEPSHIHIWELTLLPEKD